MTTLEERLADERWHLLCHASDVAAPRSYVRIDLGAEREAAAWRAPSGELVVFDNLCPHRGARIFTDSDGVAELACGYHGWCRSPENPPNAPYYLQAAGDFLFVARCPRGGLEDEFGAPVYEALKTFSRAVGAVCFRTADTWRARWTDAVEGALEDIHVPLIHRQTLGRLGFRDRQWIRSGEAGASIFQATISERARGAISTFHPVASESQYHAVFVPPFVQLSTTAGAAFSLQRWVPGRGPRLTLFSTRLYASHKLATDAALAPAGRSKASEYLTAAWRSSIAVFREDRAAVERISPLADRSGQLLAAERQIVWFRAGVFGEPVTYRDGMWEVANG